MSLTRRYTPEHSPGESSVFGYDFSFIIPPGVGINDAQLSVWLNTAVPQNTSSTDWVFGPVGIVGRAVYARLTGGVEGRDYQVRWRVTDTQGNIWPRAGLILCAWTS